MKKKYILCLIVIFCLSSLLIYFFSYKDFNKTEDNDLLIAAYINGELSSSFPSDSNYNATVECNNIGTGSVSWDGSKWSFNVSNITSGNIKCNAYFNLLLDTSGANEPVLVNNLIPVYYDENDDVWKKADSNNADANYKWHDYNTGMWANAVSVTYGTRAKYNSASLGTIINMNDIMGMYVWIPRYEYKIDNFGNVTTPAEIHINFIPVSATTPTSGYIIHPTFKNVSADYNGYKTGGWDKEQSGIWFGKFETGYATNISTTTGAISANILIKPNVYSMKKMTVFNEYTTAQKVATDHGLSNVDTHMSKNDEWGAVGYLSLSKYGKFSNSDYTGTNKEVYVNNSLYTNSSTSETFCVTGRSNGMPDGGNGAANVQYGTYEYNNCPASSYSKTACTKAVRDTNKTKGTGASTSGTIYGVYDMSGGCEEYTMGYFTGPAALIAQYEGGTASKYFGYAGSANIDNSSGFSSEPNKKYWNRFSSNTSDNANVIEIQNLCSGNTCQGMGFNTEIGTYAYGGSNNRTWFGDEVWVLSGDIPWSTRGSGINSASPGRGGLFSMWGSSGVSANLSFRVVISV